MPFYLKKGLFSAVDPIPGDERRQLQREALVANEPPFVGVSIPGFSFLNIALEDGDLAYIKHAVGMAARAY